MLQNNSFENPVTSGIGNHFYATIPHWAITNVTPANPSPFNIILAGAGYANNPEATPPDGGAQYLDINAASGTIQQSFTLPGDGMVSMGGWFSVRDFPQALGGLNLRIVNGSGVTVASASTSFTASDPIGLWKHASVQYVPLPAGTYTFEADIPNYANFDIASVVYYPPLTVDKSGSALWDPVNGSIDPKMVPGAIAAYAITVTSPASYTVTADSMELVDATPEGAAIVLTDAGGGTGPITLNAGGSGLSVHYGGLGSSSDGVEFSADRGISWTYVPTVDADGIDPAVTHVRIRLSGSMAAASSATLGLRYMVRPGNEIAAQ